jgi:hypothetical protein
MIPTFSPLSTAISIVFYRTALLVCTLFTMGCVQFVPARRAGSDPMLGQHLSQNCLSANCDECSAITYDAPLTFQRLPDRIPLVSKLGGIKDTMHRKKTHLTERCESLRHDYRVWRRGLEEKKQAPPWPRFHPVPTRDVFAPTPETELDAPVIYGRFLSESEDAQQMAIDDGIYQSEEYSAEKYSNEEYSLGESEG